MSFEAGQILVHPHHGPATVRKRATRTVQGEAREYLVLEVHGSKLTVGVPVGNAHIVGLREVFAGDQLERLLDTLRAPTEHEETQWSRRVKGNYEKMCSGDLYRVAEVVRDLIHRRDRQSISRSEAAMLKDASGPLRNELRLALNLSDEQAAEYLEQLCQAHSKHEPAAAARQLQPAV